MKSKGFNLLRSLLLFCAAACFMPETTAQQSTAKKDHKKYLKTYNKVQKKLNKQFKEEEEKKGKKEKTELEEERETPEKWYAQDYLITMNRDLERPTPEVLWPVLSNLYASNNYQISAMPGLSQTPWTERGPNNTGGRTRALVWDPYTSNKVWAGGVTGGLWYNSDITNASNSWTQVSGLWSNLAVTCIAFDPVNAGTIYVGTGEWFSVGTSRGAGIWKSTDTGRTWSQLSSTTGFYYVNDIVVRKNGSTAEVYAAVDAGYVGSAWHGLSTYGIMRSTNGGSSWTNVAPNVPVQGQKYAVGDLELGADNRIWAGTKKNPYGGTDAGGGRILKSDNGTSWTTSYTHSDVTGRVELACAPSTANYVYALVEASGQLDAIVVTVDNGANWTSKNEPADVDNGIPDTDFTRGQAWYDLIAAVSPADSNTVYIGGVDLFKSTDAGSNWSHISKWSNNNNLNSLACAIVHADQHAISFKPGSSTTAVVGNDGGVYYTSQIQNGASSAVFSSRNKGYNVTQFYYGDLSKTSGSNKFIGGAQDNGSIYFNSTGMSSGTEVNGGDGAASFIHEGADSRQVCAYVYNQYKYTNNNWTNTNDLIADGATGAFINPAEWDNNQSGLFSNKNDGNLYRISLGSSPGTLNTITYKSSTTDDANCMEAVKLSSGKTRLYVGTVAGSIYYTDDAWATTPTFTATTGSMNAGSITSIYSHKGTDTVLVTLGNYGSTFKNIYVSTDNGSTWTNKEGSLPDMPVRDIVMNPANVNEVLIATEIGVYGTTNFWSSTPTWNSYTQGMGAVRVMQLKFRAADKMILAVTHGRGLFTSDAWGKLSPIANFGTDKTDVCTNQVIQFSDSSLNTPTQWTWTVSPRNMEYKNGTDSTSQHPFIRFTKAGTYSITLIASNSLGNNSKTRTNYITVSDTQRGQATLLLSRSSNCAGDTLLLTLVPGADLNTSNLTVNWFKNGSSFSTSGYSKIVTPAAKDSFWVTLNNSYKCAAPANFQTSKVKPVVNPIVNANAKLNAISAGCQGKALTVTTTVNNLGSSPVWTWYVDGNVQSSNSSSLTLSSPSNGAKVYATVYVSGSCVKPQNLIYTDTATLVVNPKPATPVVSRNFDTLKAADQGAGTYNWYKNGVLAGSGKTYKATSNGNYKCVVIQNGCSSDSSAVLPFNSLNVNWINGKVVKLYPNPSKERIMLSGMGVVKTENMEITDASGKSVKSFVKLSNLPNGDTELNIKNLSAGVYYLLYSESRNETPLKLQFIKE